MPVIPEPDGYATARRGAIAARLRAVVTTRSFDRDTLITLDEALTALGTDGVLGQWRMEVPVASIVGTIARTGEFDREFRPLTPRVRQRWQAVLRADTTRALPPVELTRLGDMHFVRDGHHRIAVARALGRPTVEANVVRLCTIAFGMLCLRLAHLPSKAAERLFLERVPLPFGVRPQLWLDQPADWSRLADSAEAWGFRRGMDGRTERAREQFAEAWWAEEVLPSIAQRPDLARDRDVESYVAVLTHRQGNRPI